MVEGEKWAANLWVWNRPRDEIDRAKSKARGSNGLSVVFKNTGSDEVELHKDFRLYLHTAMQNPHYAPEIQALCTVVNFTMTPEGLEEMLQLSESAEVDIIPVTLGTGIMRSETAATVGVGIWAHVNSH